ncbi:unnamed protein product [Blepharisma stoltei]|uniref:Uncharacterized protein n=1 Tax=Blepharisma stoltei TaxID=1481888 RepID=A0AAU9K106_9CILI|nr:unnamed protein product [Blepharisma stoltei]
MSNFTTQGFSKRLRSQIPYYQASNKEISDDLKLIGIDLTCPVETFPNDNLPKPRKRPRLPIIDEDQEENDAIDGLSALILVKNKTKKPIVPEQTETKKEGKPAQVPKEEVKAPPPQQRYDLRALQLAQMQQYLQMMSMQSNAFMSTGDWRNLNYPIQYQYRMNPNYVYNAMLSRKSGIHIKIAHMISQHQNQLNRNNAI